MSIIFKARDYKIQMLQACLTGSCGTLAFSPYDIWPAALISITGLLVITINSSANHAAWLGFLWGIGLFGSGLNWIYIGIAKLIWMPIIVNVSLVILFSVYLSLYPMLFSYLLVRICPNSNICRFVLTAPALWTIVEFFRGCILTGFPWLQFGYSQIDGPLRGIAPIFGVEAITYLLVIISGLFALSIKNRCWFPAVIGFMIMILNWPLRFLQWYHVKPERAINVALIQENISQSFKDDPNKMNLILNSYLQSTFKYIDKVQIIIWPESAIPGNEIYQNYFLTELDKRLRKNNIRLISGIINPKKIFYKYNYYNSILILGETIPYKYPRKEYYKKHHLVPFGETFPLKRIFKFLFSNFSWPMISLSQGSYIQKPLTVSKMKFTAAICYEIIFADQVRDNFFRDSDFLLTISNDVWFDHSIGPWQHFQMARMRSLELGRPLLRSTNNGITSVIYANGSIQEQLPQFHRAVLIARIIPTSGVTPYLFIGNWPIRIISLQNIFIALILNRKKIIRKLIISS